MKTIRGIRVAVALISAASALALVGGAERAMAAGQQDAVVQEKHAQLSFSVQPDTEFGEGQDAQQKVKLELFAVDAQVVKGKPYSADTSTEAVQTLPDGNHISHRTVSKFYRDSEGRTRREETFGNVVPDDGLPHEVKVFIDDPVSGTSFVLDPGSKSADKMQKRHFFLDAPKAEDDGTSIMFKSLKDSEAGVKLAPGSMTLKIQDDHSGNPNTVVIQAMDDKRDVVKEDLGARTIEGVECSGTRQTITIPAGTVGNEKPISIVTETWFAPSIEAVVESTSDDPRYGKTTYQLTNVQLSEPARSLFEPPADFKINGGK
jgi:hypothetical protein